jgi:hypothetical protein
VLGIGLNFGRLSASSDGKTLLRGELRTIHLDLGQVGSVSVPATDGDGADIEMAGRTLRFLVQDYRTRDVADIANGSILRSDGEVQITLTTAMTNQKRTLRYSLLDITGGGLIELAAGYFPVY